MLPLLLLFLLSLCYKWHNRNIISTISFFSVGYLRNSQFSWFTRTERSHKHLSSCFISMTVERNTGNEQKTKFTQLNLIKLYAYIRISETKHTKNTNWMWFEGFGVEKQLAKKLNIQYSMYFHGKLNAFANVFPYWIHSSNFQQHLSGERLYGECESNNRSNDPKADQHIFCTPCLLQSIGHCWASMMSETFRSKLLFLLDACF